MSAAADEYLKGSGTAQSASDEYLANQKAGPLDFRPGLAYLGKSVSEGTPDWLKDVVGSAASALGQPVSAIAEGLVGPTIRHGVNLVTGQENLGDVVRDIPNAPQHVLEALRATIPAPVEGKANLLEPLRGQFTGPQNIGQELRQAGYSGMLTPQDAEGMNAAFLGLPVGSAFRAATSPEGLGLVPEAVVGGGIVNKIAGPAFTAAGRGIANAEVAGLRTRAIPGVKQVLQFVKPGAELPNAQRDFFYNTLRTEEGLSDWKGFLRQRLVESGPKMTPQELTDFRTAIETGQVQALPPAQQAYANSLIKEYADRVSENVQSSMRPYERRPPIEYAGGRVVTPQASKEIFPKGQRFSSAPRGLGTGRMGEIAAQNVGLTTEQVAQKVAQASGGKLQPEQVFRDINEATLLKGAAHDTRVMHANVVRKLMDQFGHPASRGELTVADLRGVPTGFDAATQARMGTTALPKELHETLTRLNGVMQPQQWGRLSQFVKTVNDQFRKHAMFSTGMISRNMQNNLAQTAIFGNMDPETWAWAIRLRSKLASGNLTPADVAELEPMFKSGIIGHGQVAMETGTKGGKALASKVYNAPFRAMRSANQFAEDVSRMAFGKYQLNRGLSPMAAGQAVDQVLGNYSPRFQSSGFRALRSGVAPFVNWTTTIPQVFVRSVVTRPGSVGTLGVARTRALQGNEAQAAALPDYLKSQSAVPIHQGEVYIPQGYGSTDVSGMFDALASSVWQARELPALAKAGKWQAIRQKLVETPALREAIQRTYPQFGITYAALTGTDPLTGYPIKDWPKFLSRSTPALKIPNLVKDVVTKKKGAGEKARSFLTGVRTVQQ